MAAVIPDSHKDLLEQPVYVALATVMADGQPQVTPVWCSYDGAHILVNTLRGRIKEKNMKARPKVTILAIDPKDPYRWLEVRGAVEAMTEEGAIEHINQLAQLYANKKNYYGDYVPAERRHQETRVICKIKPTKVVTAGK
jgi:PPOX class probable F420-dependent enzyme